MDLKQYGRLIQGQMLAVIKLQGGDSKFIMMLMVLQKIGIFFFFLNDQNKTGGGHYGCVKITIDFNCFRMNEKVCKKCGLRIPQLESH